MRRLADGCSRFTTLLYCYSSVLLGIIMSGKVVTELLTSMDGCWRILSINQSSAFHFGWQNDTLRHLWPLLKDEAQMMSWLLYTVQSKLRSKKESIYSNQSSNKLMPMFLVPATAPATVETNPSSLFVGEVHSVCGNNLGYSAKPKWIITNHSSQLSILVQCTFTLRPPTVVPTLSPVTTQFSTVCTVGS